MLGKHLILKIKINNNNVYCWNTNNYSYDYNISLYDDLLKLENNNLKRNYTDTFILNNYLSNYIINNDIKNILGSCGLTLSNSNIYTPFHIDTINDVYKPNVYLTNMNDINYSDGWIYLHEGVKIFHLIENNDCCENINFLKISNNYIQLDDLQTNELLYKNNNALWDKIYQCILNKEILYIFHQAGDIVIKLFKIA